MQNVKFTDKTKAKREFSPILGKTRFERNLEVCAWVVIALLLGTGLGWSF